MPPSISPMAICLPSGWTAMAVTPLLCPQAWANGLPEATSQSDATRTNAQNPFCDASSGWLTQAKFLAVYTIPRVDVQLSGTVQNIVGPPAQANLTVSNAVAAASLGRNLSGNASNVTVSVADPLALYGDRINQVDTRLAKIFRFGPGRTAINLDIFNLFNSNARLGVLNAYGGSGTRAWQAPQAPCRCRPAWCPCRRARPGGRGGCRYRRR